MQAEQVQTGRGRPGGESEEEERRIETGIAKIVRFAMEYHSRNALRKCPYRSVAFKDLMFARRRMRSSVVDLVPAALESKWLHNMLRRSSRRLKMLWEGNHSAGKLGS